MNRIKSSNEKLYLVVACLAAVAVFIPVVVWGIPNTTDLPQHFRFAQTFYDSFASGNGYPGWASAENFGYGDIGIRFYPPLEYLFLSVLRGAFGDWFDAALFGFAFWMVAGNVGVYLWARCWLSPKQSALAACLFTFIPLHLLQLYSDFNNYSELAATAVMLFCLVFLTRIFQRRGRAFDVLGLSVSFALLTLTHLPLTVIGSLCFGVYALTFAREKDFFRSIIKAGVAFAVGLAGSAFYWSALVGEMQWVNHASDKFASGYYSYKNGFFPFSYFTDLPAVTYFNYVTDIAVVLSLTFLASAAIYFIYKKRSAACAEFEQTTSIYKSVLPLGLFALFMITPLSDFVWRVFTPLQKVQFPSRWLSIVAMSGALVASAALPYLVKGEFLKKRIWLYGCALAALTVAGFNAIYIVNPTAFIPLDREKFDAKLRELPETTSYPCWWTIWSKADALKTSEKISAGGRAAKVVAWNLQDREFEIAAGENNTNARVAAFYYPLWRATVNDKPVEILKDENGAMLIPITGEKSVVKIHFQESSTVKLASAASLAAWLFLGASGLFLLGGKLFAARKISAPLNASPAAAS